MRSVEELQTEVNINRLCIHPWAEGAITVARVVRIAIISETSPKCTVRTQVQAERRAVAAPPTLRIGLPVRELLGFLTVTS